MRAPPERKRTASLQRRGLFDVVSPFTVFLAVLAYLLFAAFMITIQQHPIAGFAGYFFLRTITMVCALNAFVVYWLLYGRKRWTLETRAYRAQAVEVQVKIVFYVSIAAIVFISLLTTLRLLNLRGWMPFAMSVYFVIIMLFTSMMLFALRRQAEADRLGPSPASIDAL
jgi:magnesium-transporting ATPase (P-type)